MYEKRVELMCLLNDRMIEPTSAILAIAELFDIEFLDTENQHGWDMVINNLN